MSRQLPYPGIPIPRLTTRRLTLLLAAVSLSAFCLITLLTSAVPSSPSLSTSERKTTNTDARDYSSATKSAQLPASPPSQPPPRQSDDTYATSAWLADSNALSKVFSNEVTLDNDRALLPDLAIRQPIYCYYDALDTTAAAENDTDIHLLLMWRRAWWARGFKPLILGPDEAKSHPLYSKLDETNAPVELKKDILRWLAWDTVGGGLLSQFVLFPMGTDYDFLPSLRRGEYSTLSRAGNLSSALFWGSRDHVHDAVQIALDSANLVSASSLLDVLGDDAVKEQETPPVLAFYNATSIAKKYPKLVLEKNKHQFGTLRNELINAHLQSSWQNSYAMGIDVINPFPEHMGAMVKNATDLAKALASCPPTPLAGSCPPNIPKCGPCGATTPLVVRDAKTFMNESKVFTIGMVPHPWTRTALANMQGDFNATIIRDSERDGWLRSVTKGLGTSQSQYTQVLQFKKAVSGDTADTRSLWFTAEDPFPAQLDWYFGFAIPKKIIDDGRSESPVPSDHINDPDRPDLAFGPKAVTELDRERELAILLRARDVIVGGARRAASETRRRRASLEAWHMADTEAWGFARATHDRRTLERKRWEDAAKYTEKQRLVSDAGWAPGMNVTGGNRRKEAERKAKARD
ncbi:hypothetical protein ISF_08476 [Cordyceps fumosorosea ARSEF 2679]|uniref:Uncharacterized protein n=1 Tax=Cordyceps fumosorosea (strain ARSEF 2679) TaxID=1081104 RepID=A0A167M6H8_CORFA|nr:hypothetical protein ISF_08476 [Cordyceps fumosorosea ARSEF 2679]OAA53996.1 hypothetical protein ISF_08476 [Cordyceps fumosorosea ARSEF 2679]